MRTLKAFVLAGALILLATCSHEPRRGTPGVRCSIASCCFGWIWMGVCMRAQPPDCGCSCEQAPNPYGTLEQCLADHPEAMRSVAADAGQPR